MTCEELREDYTAWALGVAGDPERAEIAEHLERKCPNCVAGVIGAMATVAAMSGAVPIAEPPKHLRKRVMAAVAREPKRSRVAAFLPWAITAAMSIALIGIGISGRRQIGDTPKLQQALSILNDPTTTDVTFGEADKPAARGRIFVNANRGIVLMGAGLPRLEAGTTYELWVVAANGTPSPSGLFQSQPDATAVFVQPGPVANAKEIEVTVEPLGGSTRPTTTPFIAKKL